jgi:hypothetical protein
MDSHSVGAGFSYRLQAGADRHKAGVLWIITSRAGRVVGWVKSWEIYGKSWKIIGKYMGKSCEHVGKPWKTMQDGAPFR